jgi:cell division protease FtsH
VRESVIEPAGPRSSAVPPAGKPRPRPDAPPTGDVAPQPQG